MDPAAAFHRAPNGGTEETSPFDIRHSAVLRFVFIFGRSRGKVPRRGTMFRGMANPQHPTAPSGRDVVPAHATGFSLPCQFVSSERRLCGAGAFDILSINKAIEFHPMEV